jgi:hypothetical protein
MSDASLILFLTWLLLVIAFSSKVLYNWFVVNRYGKDIHKVAILTNLILSDDNGQKVNIEPLFVWKEVGIFSTAPIAFKMSFSCTYFQIITVTWQPTRKKIIISDYISYENIKIIDGAGLNTLISIFSAKVLL